IVMANPIPENLNVPNEDVLEEDPHHLLDYDEEEDPKIDIEEEEPEEDPVEEPKPLAGHGDQFDAHPNPQLGNMNGWVDDNDDVEEEDDENEDVDIEEDDDAEIIFPYEVQGDQTSPPRDESFDSEFEAEEADDELKVEEAGVEPDIEEAGDAKIGKIEREILHHDLSGVEETLGKVVERLKVLESEENETLRKKLAKKEVLLDLTRMERDRAEKRLSESIWWNERFYLEMVRKGAVPKPPSNDEGSERPRKMPKKSDEDEGPFDPRGPLIGARPTVPELTGCTYATFIKCDPLPFNRTEGTVGLCQWFEKLESVFQISECKEKDRVKFAMATLRGRALTWWNGKMKAMGIEAANNTPWSEVRKWMTEEFCPWCVIQKMEQELYNLRMKGMDIDGYTNRFHELALLCPRMPATINDAVRLAYQLAGQLIQDKADEATEGEKRKGAMKNDVPNNNETFQKCKNKRHAGDCWKCTKCGKLGHKTKRCRTSEMSCYNYNEKGHRKKDCPKLGRNGQGGNNHGGAYQLGAVNAQEDPKVVTELGSFDVIIGMDWLSKNDSAILCGEKKVRIPPKNKALIIEEAIVVPDTEETLMLAEESRSNMIKNQNDPQMIDKKVITKPINYAILNQLSTYFETRFVPQTESSTEQAFGSQYSVQPDEPNLSGTTIVEVPKELPKVSMRDTWSSQESALTFAELFEIHNLKAQAKDTVILKLKEKLNSFNGDVKERKVKRDIEEIETLNIALDHKHSLQHNPGASCPST
nr:hypothetical protein [Tanacetum cinerariifolium]